MLFVFKGIWQVSAEQIVFIAQKQEICTLKEANQKYSQDVIAGHFSCECALKIAGKAVGNILERKSESDVYGMLPAEGQMSKVVDIYGIRTCDVVFNVPY